MIDIIKWFIRNCMLFKSKDVHFADIHFALGILAWWFILVIIYLITLR